MKTRVFQPTPLNYARLSNLLRRGELVGVPTETVYGLAADATNSNACRKIFEAKKRPLNDPLIVHVHDRLQALSLTQWDEVAEKLAEAFWPGPLTIVLPRSHRISDIITSGQDTVAVRMPSHPIFRNLLKTCALPLAAPSANVFGYISPTTSAHVFDGLVGKIPAIMEGGPCEIGLESTIVSLHHPNSAEILRPGAITANDIENIIHERVSVRKRAVDPTEQSEAPGMLERHYSPSTPLVLHRKLPANVPADEAVVHFQQISVKKRSKNHFALTGDGKGSSAAKQVFSVLRNLDRGKWNRIHFEKPPNADPWATALNDRLKRAASRD